jgi:transcriptional regulator with XRE-family HTH domain
MKQNVDALAEAVRERREELGLTQQAAAERSRAIDLKHFDGGTRKKPGLSARSWSEIERALPKKRGAHTQLLLDATLLWPKGTAHAHLHDTPLPSGPPLVPEAAGELESTAVRLENARMRQEIAELRTEVRELAALVRNQLGGHGLFDNGA